jgi:hypothetical protein
VSANLPPHRWLRNFAERWRNFVAPNFNLLHIFIRAKTVEEAFYSDLFGAGTDVAILKICFRRNKIGENKLALFDAEDW